MRRPIRQQDPQKTPPNMIKFIRYYRFVVLHIQLLDKICFVQLSTISVKSQAKHDNKPPDTTLGRFYGLDRSYHATNVNFKEKLDEKLANS